MLPRQPPRGPLPPPSRPIPPILISIGCFVYTCFAALCCFLACRVRQTTTSRNKRRAKEEEMEVVFLCVRRPCRVSAGKRREKAQAGRGVCKCGYGVEVGASPLCEQWRHKEGGEVEVEEAGSPVPLSIGLLLFWGQHKNHKPAGRRKRDKTSGGKQLSKARRCLHEEKRGEETKKRKTSPALSLSLSQYPPAAARALRAGAAGCCGPAPRE